jgi:glycine oxidase
MSSPISLPIAVIGAGALGAATALALARAGARVVLIDESPLGRNASGVAAGMLAPAMESSLDPVSAGRFTLLSAARDLWPVFAQGLGPTGLEACGALFKADPILVEDAAQRLRGQGAHAQRLEAGVLFTPEDWRLEPRLALAAMLDGLQRLGGEVRRASVGALQSGAVVLEGGAVVPVAGCVLACGFGGQHLARALAILEPIKGQVLRYPDVELSDGPVLRGPGGYVVPSRDGPVCGATMEAGVADLSIDDEAVARLRAQAARLAPQLAGARPEANAGVRATTPDGLPMVGPAGEAGVWLAAGARRDGWLLAPMIAASLVRQIVHGAGPEPAFDPARFADQG